MAVDQAKVKARLKVLFPKANLSQKRIDEISAKLAKKPADDADDTAIDAVITDANELLDFEALAKEDDRIRNLEAKTKQPTTDPIIPATDPKQPANEEEIPSWAKAMMQTMESLKQGEVVKSKQSSIAAAFEKSDVLKNLKPNIKDSWLKRIAITEGLTEEQIAEQITAFETEYQELTQTAADSQNYAGPVPAFTHSKDEITVDDIKDIYEN